jgi:hypothetical protein
MELQGRGGDEYVGASAGVKHEIPRDIHIIVSFELERVTRSRWQGRRGSGAQDEELGSHP